MTLEELIAELSELLIENPGLAKEHVLYDECDGEFLTTIAEAKATTVAQTKDDGVYQPESLDCDARMHMVDGARLIRRVVLRRDV